MQLIISEILSVMITEHTIPAITIDIICYKKEHYKPFTVYYSCYLYSKIRSIMVISTR